MHDHTAAIKPKRFAEELEWVWNERAAALYRRLTRIYPWKFMKLLDSTIELLDRKSTRLNSSHTVISYAVFCLKKKKDGTNAISEHVNQYMITGRTKQFQ